MTEIRFVCPGSCHGSVTKEQWDFGARNCIVSECNHYGQPLQRRTFCPNCKRYYEGEHSCPA